MHLALQRKARSSSSAKSITSKKSSTSKSSNSSKRSIFSFRKECVSEEDRNPPPEDGDQTLESGFARDIADDVKKLSVAAVPSSTYANTKSVEGGTPSKGDKAKDQSKGTSKGKKNEGKRKSKGRSRRKSRSKKKSQSSKNQNSQSGRNSEADCNLFGEMLPTPFEVDPHSSGCVSNDCMTDFIFPVDGRIGLKKNLYCDGDGDASIRSQESHSRNKKENSITDFIFPVDGRIGLKKNWYCDGDGDTSLPSQESHFRNRKESSRPAGLVEC